MRRIGDRYSFRDEVFEAVRGVGGDYLYEIVDSYDNNRIGKRIWLILHESYATYLGNFAKSTNFNSLYEKLVG